MNMFSPYIKISQMVRITFLDIQKPRSYQTIASKVNFGQSLLLLLLSTRTITPSDYRINQSTIQIFNPP